MSPDSDLSALKKAKDEVEKRLQVVLASIGCGTLSPTGTVCKSGTCCIPEIGLAKLRALICRSQIEVWEAGVRGISKKSLSNINPTLVQKFSDLHASLGCPSQLKEKRTVTLKFPNMVALNAVGCRKAQKSATKGAKELNFKELLRIEMQTTRFETTKFGNSQAMFSEKVCTSDVEASLDIEGLHLNRLTERCLRIT